MTYMLEDGSGSGKLAKIDSTQRLLVRGVNRTESSQASVELGKAFNVNSGIITLTSASESAVLYMKNNEPTDSIIVNTFVVILGNTTGGSGDVTVDLLRNPTTGTIVSGATDADMPGVNRNFGSTRTIAADIYKGAEGNTFTNGDPILRTLYDAAPIRNTIDIGDIVIPPGSSIGVTIQPATSNTSQQVSIAMAVHLETL